MKLYELTNNYLKVLELAEEGETEAIIDTLAAIEEAIEDKAENIAKFIKNMEADVEVIKAEEKRLAERRKALENKITSVKEYLHQQLESAGLEKVKRPTLTISIQNNPPSVKVIDEKLLTAYMVHKEPVLDKKSLLADLKEGKLVDGAELFQGRSIRIK